MDYSLSISPVDGSNTGIFRESAPSPYTALLRCLDALDLRLAEPRDADYRIMIDGFGTYFAAERA